MLTVKAVLEVELSYKPSDQELLRQLDSLMDNLELDVLKGRHELIVGVRVKSVDTGNRA